MPALSMHELPRAVASFGAAIHAGRLYVFGGHVGETHAHSVDNLSPDFVELDLGTGESRVLPGGERLQGLALVAAADDLLRVGGLSARNGAGEPDDLHSVDTCSFFDPRKDTWTSGPPLPSPRSSHDAAVAGSHVIVAGGWNLQGEASVWHETTCLLDLARTDRSWIEVPQPFRRRALALASDGRRVWAVGGMGEDDSPSTAVDVLDLDTGSWSSGPDLPSSGFGASAAFHAGALYVTTLDGKLHRLDEREARWETLGSLAFPRMFSRLLSDPSGGLLAAGGADRSGHIPWVERIPVSGAGIGPSLSVFEIESPGRAKQRMGGFVQGGALILFGGNRNLDSHQFEPEDFVPETLRVRLACARIDALGDLPFARQSMESAVIEASAPRYLALGGFGHDGDVERSFADVLSFDPVGRSWTRAAVEMPAPRTQFGSVVHGGEIWVFGGLDYDPRRGDDAFRHALEIAVIDPEQDPPTARILAERMPGERRAFGGAELDGRYYVVGGMRSGFETVETCEAFDFATRTWSSFPCPSRPRVSPVLVALGGRLYLAGGSSAADGGKSHPDERIEVFDPERGEWSVLVEDFPLEPSNLFACAWNGRVLFVSAMEAEPVLRFALLTPPP